MKPAVAFLIFATLSVQASDTGHFTKAGEFVRPVNYREWVFLSSGLGMTYGPNAPAPGAPLRFDNVFANPSAYQAFLKTGTWPNGTVLILEIRESASKGSINQHGQFQTDLVAVEAHVKDTKRFAGTGWAFYDLSPRDGRLPVSAKPFPAGNRCQTCHAASGAVDDTFVQFYPELIPVAKKFRTWHE